MSGETFEAMLSGGHPNSLGRTIEVVDIVLADQSRLEDLYNCYFTTDEVVRLRTSNAIKRVSREQPEWLVPYIDRFIGQIAVINQASTQWTLADLFKTLRPHMTAAQQAEATLLLKKNLETHYDWIVLNNTMQTLGEWSQEDEALRAWLLPQLARLQLDQRKSIAKRAKKLSDLLS